MSSIVVLLSTPRTATFFWLTYWKTLNWNNNLILREENRKRENEMKSKNVCIFLWKKKNWWKETRVKRFVLFCVLRRKVHYFNERLPIRTPTDPNAIACDLKIGKNIFWSWNFKNSSFVLFHSRSFHHGIHGYLIMRPYWCYSCTPFLPIILWFYHYNLIPKSNSINWFVFLNHWYAKKREQRQSSNLQLSIQNQDKQTANLQFQSFVSKFTL